VIEVVRSAEGEKLVRSLGGEPRQAYLFDAEALARAVEGAEVLIHAATAIPIQTKPAPEDWAMNDRIRRVGTRALAECARRIGARRYLFQSIVWVARPADQSAFDETSPVAPHPIYDSAADGEAIAQQSGCEVSVLRCGGFYGADSRHTQELARLLKEHKMPIVGDGKAIWAMLHADDAAAAFVTAARGSDRVVARCRRYAGDGDGVSGGLCQAPGSASAQESARVPGAPGGGGGRGGVSDHVHPDLQRALQAGGGVGAEVPELSGGVGADCGRVEGVVSQAGSTLPCEKPFAWKYVGSTI